MKALFVGYATIDFIEGRPHPGGAGGAMSINAAGIGVESALFAPLSQDQYGKFYTDILKKAKVDTTLCSREAPSLPTCTVVDTLGLGSTRKWVANGAQEVFERQTVTADQLAGFDAIFLCNAPKKVAETVAQAVTKRTLIYIPGPVTTSQPGWVSPKVLEKTQLVFGNIEESPFIEAANPFRHGVALFIATAGKDGGTVHTRQGKIPFAADPDVHVVDATGAGDSFCLGFSLEWKESGDILAAISAGKRLAARCLKQEGCVLVAFFDGFPYHSVNV